MRSPSSLATRFKFLYEILPVSSSSNNLNALRISVEDLVRHHFQELFVFDRARAIVIDVGDHFLDLLFLWLEAQRTHRNLQLLRVDRARSIGIKQIEGFFDLLLLLLSQLLLLLATSVEAAESHCEKMES